jgi:hypothetical protein
LHRGNYKRCICWVCGVVAPIVDGIEAIDALSNEVAARTLGPVRLLGVIVDVAVRVVAPISRVVAIKSWS